MVYMEKKMQDELMQDIQEGKIFGLRLIEHPIAIIQNNVDAEMFGIVREIIDCDKEKFFLKTKSIAGQYFDCEAYYAAFNYYDGDILRKIEEFPNVVDEKDSVKVTEYEVLRSY